MNERKNKTEGITPSVEEELKRLLQSKIITEVYTRKLAPKTLDKQFKQLRDDNRDLRKKHMLDQSEIVRLRRQIEFLIGHDNAEV